MTNMQPKYTLAAADTDPPITWGYWVVEGQFLAGAYPGDREPEYHAQNIQTLLDAGIRLFVNLMEPDETNHLGEPFVPYDDLAGQLCPAASSVRLPIRDLSTPSVEEMQTILDMIDDSVNDGRPVYIHCWGGVGRTGTVVGCWLLRHGLAKPANVLDTLMQVRKQDRERRHRMSPETPEQQRFVRQWLANEPG